MLFLNERRSLENGWQTKLWVCLLVILLDLWKLPMYFSGLDQLIWRINTNTKSDLSGGSVTYLEDQWLIWSVSVLDGVWAVPARYWVRIWIMKFLNLSFTYGMLGPTNFALMLFKRFFIISHFFRTLNTLVSRRLFRCSICFLIWMVKNNSSDDLVPSSQWFIRVGEGWKNEKI